MGSKPLTTALRETLDCFDSHKPLTTTEVASRLEVGRRSTYERLDRLVDYGRLESKKVGASGRVWWREPTDGRTGHEEQQGAGQADHKDQPGETAYKEQLQATDHAEQLRATTARLEALFENSPDMIDVLGPEGTLLEVNTRLCEELGYTETELIGRRIWEIDQSIDADGVRTLLANLSVGELRTFDARYQRRDGSMLPVEVNLTRLNLERKDRFVAISRDSTERKRHERKLQRKERRFQTLIENFPNGAVALVNEDCQYTTFGGTPEGKTNLTRADLEGRPIRELPPALADVVVPRYEAALAGHPSKFVDTVNEMVYQFHFLPVRDDDGEIFAAMGMSQDITERHTREHALHEMHDIVSNRNQSFDEQVQALLELGRAEIETQYGTLSEIRGDEYMFEIIVGGDDWVQAGDVVPVVETNCETVVQTEETVVLGDLEADDQTEPDPVDFSEWGLSCYLGAPVFIDNEVYGTFCFYGTEPRDTPFSEWEVTLIELMTQWISCELGRQRATDRLHEKNDRLEALNTINEVVQEITDAVIDQSTREEVETTVCNQLAATDSYSTAWIAALDRRTNEITPRAVAGVEPTLEESDWRVDGTHSGNRNPVKKTFQSGEMHVSRAASEDSSVEPWQDGTETDGYRSVATIPIVHEGTLYGVLTVHSDRTDGFDVAERAVVSQIGEIVGHAIATLAQKQALMGDEITEISFCVPKIFDSFPVSVSLDGTFSLDRTVAIGDDRFLMYGSVTGNGMDVIETIVGAEAVPEWEAVNELRTVGDTTHFEVRMSEPPVMSTIAAHGGYFSEMSIDSGDAYLEIHVAPSADPSQILDIVTSVFPSAEMIRKHQTTRVDPSLQAIRQELPERLTDRQQVALEAGYYAGFFDWPRQSSGETVAASLDIGSSTFHQHIRKAEKKLLDLVFTESPSELE